MQSSEAILCTKQNKAVAVISVNVPHKTRLITGGEKNKQKNQDGSCEK